MYFYALIFFVFPFLSLEVYFLYISVKSCSLALPRALEKLGAK